MLKKKNKKLNIMEALIIKKPMLNNINYYEHGHNVQTVWKKNILITLET